MSIWNTVKSYFKALNPIMMLSINHYGLKVVSHNTKVLETYEVNKTYLQALFLQQKKNISCKKATNTNVKLDVKLTMWWQLGYKWPNSSHLGVASFVHPLNPKIILNLRLEKRDMIILVSRNGCFIKSTFKSAHNLNVQFTMAQPYNLGLCLLWENASLLGCQHQITEEKNSWSTF